MHELIVCGLFLGVGGVVCGLFDGVYIIVGRECIHISG